jgi:hypothetical protein
MEALSSTYAQRYIVLLCTYLHTYEDRNSPNYDKIILQALRPIFNITPRGKLWPPGAKLSPRGEVIPWGVKFTVCPSILLSSRECSPLGVNEGVSRMSQDVPRGHSSPLGVKFTPGGQGEVKNGPLPSWNSGHRVRLQIRRSRARIPPGCKVFRKLYIVVLLSYVT